MGVTFGLRLWAKIKRFLSIKGTLKKSAAKATHGIVTVSYGNKRVHLVRDLSVFTEDNLNTLYNCGGIISKPFLMEKH